ncbi:hypothetical protein D3C77_520590 [compost metagenome]
MHLVLFGNAQALGVLGMNFHEGPRIELVQRRDFAGLGQGVPLVLDPPGVEHQRKLVIGQLGAGQTGPGKKAGLAAGRGEGNRRYLALGIAKQHLADPVIAITQRAAGVATSWCTRPLLWRLAQSGITDAAHIVASGRVPGLADFVEHCLGIGVTERLRITHGAGHTGDDLPVG